MGKRMLTVVISQVLGFVSRSLRGGGCMLVFRAGVSCSRWYTCEPGSLCLASDRPGEREAVVNEGTMTSPPAHESACVA